MSGRTSQRSSTCDLCRKRKVKCVPSPPEVSSPTQCKGCYNLDEPCTYDYVVKRAGRKTTRVNNELKRARTDGSGSFPYPDPSASHHRHDPLALSDLDHEHNSHPRPPSFQLQSAINGHNDPFSGGETAQNKDPYARYISDTAIYPAVASPSRAPIQAGPSASPHQPDDQAALSGLLNLRHHVPQYTMPQSHHNQTDPSLENLRASPAYLESNSNQVLQLEQVISWENASFFLSLYLRFQHALMPLVHKPTFSKDLLDRRFSKDEVFRGLIFSLIAHVISQVPKSRMIHRFSQSELEHLQIHCHQAARTIMVRHQHEPSLELIVAHYADVATCATLGQTELSGVTFAVAVRMAFALGLHRSKSSLGGDFLQTEMQRRVFWVLYQTDKTEASVGMPSLMHDYEGVPPMPLEVDDEYITPQGYLPQPPSQPSTMTGFANSCRLFVIMSQCLFRHRMHCHLLCRSEHPSVVLAWVEDNRTELDNIIKGLSGPWKSEPDNVKNDEERLVFGTQRANILITATSLHFALLDLKALLLPKGEVAQERESVARQSYQLLSSIPIEHLAMNGESIRGKVLRIIVALMSTSTSTPDEAYNRSVKDWWTILSQVQWVQVIPLDHENLS